MTTSRHRLRTVLLLATAALPFLALAPREKGKDDESATATPFYRKYLVPGDPLDDRILEYERLVAAEPNSAARRNDFGNLLAQRRFPEQAREQYEKALELDREHFLAAYNLGLLHESEGKIHRAIGAYRKAVSRKPGFPHARFRLGRLYEKRGLQKLAVSEYAKAFRLDSAMRDPKVNPLVVDSHLIDRASLENYSRDLATATLPGSLAYSNGQPGGRPPMDQPIWSDEVDDPSSPEPVATSPSSPPVSVPQTSPPRVAAPVAPAPPAEFEITPEEGGELPPAPAGERPPYIGGFRPTPTP